MNILSPLPKKHFVPLIYESNLAIPPAGFNSVCISLCADLKSSLNWDAQIARAHAIEEKGLSILWELELGIDKLEEELLQDEAIYKTLEFSILHFIDQVLPPFAECTLGVLLFRGKIPFLQTEALKIFASLFPDALDLFLACEAKEGASHYAVFKFLCSEDLEHFRFILKGEIFEKFPFALPFIGWGSAPSCLGKLSEHLTPLIPLQRPSCAVILPSDFSEEFEKALRLLEEKNIPFRLIPESQIITSWDGMDYFLAFPQFLTKQGIRKLLGFCAAGGTIVPIGTKDLLFPNAISFDLFLAQFV